MAGKYNPKQILDRPIREGIKDISGKPIGFLSLQK